MSSNRVQRQRRKVVIIGGGFGGMEAARRLKKADVEVTVVDRHNHLLFQPLIYQVAAGALSSGEVAAPIRHMLKRQANASVVMATVTDLDHHPISLPDAYLLATAKHTGSTIASFDRKVRDAADREGLITA